jgi:hypothetical protein
LNHDGYEAVRAKGWLETVFRGGSEQQSKVGGKLAL